MKRRCDGRFNLLQADITSLEVDAIVNVANQSLLGGGGVDGAIHRAAGVDLLEACQAIAQIRPGVRCPTGEARISPGFDLPARWVIHTVGPVWEGGANGEASLLAACYTNSLKVAAMRGDIGSIAFPAISTGVFGYPLDQAAQVAVTAVLDWRNANDQPAKVIFCCFDEEAEACYKRAMAQVGP